MKIKIYGSAILIASLLATQLTTMAAERIEVEPELNLASLPDYVLSAEIAPMLSAEDLLHLILTSRRYRDLLTEELGKRDIKYWSQPIITSQELPGSFAGKSMIICLVFSSDSKILGGIKCDSWDDCFSVRRSFSDSKILENSGSFADVKWWDVESGRLLKNLPANTRWAEPVHFSPDGKVRADTYFGFFSDKIYVSICNKNNIRLFLLELTGHADQVTSTVFSPDGKVIASASCDGMIRLWKAKPKEANDTSNQAWWANYCTIM